MALTDFHKIYLDSIYIKRCQPSSFDKYPTTPMLNGYLFPSRRAPHCWQTYSSGFILAHSQSCSNTPTLDYFCFIN